MTSLAAALGGRSLRARLAPIDAAMLGRLALFALGALVIWISPRPLMIDLPQHAGQVALLHDLALGCSPWAGEIHVNLLTPYLIGYGLALPLAFVMSAAAALKVVLTAAYGAFIWACIAIRRELGASPRLDAFYAFSFFGFAYAWGMYTFLVAAPLGLAFIWLSIRYARSGLARQGAGLAALGLALLLSHGLVFLFAGAIGGLILLVRAKSVRQLIVRSWPFWILLAAAAAFAILTRQREAAITHDFAAKVVFGAWRAHLLSALLNPFDAPFSPWPAFCIPIFGLPLIAGFRPDWRAREALVIVGGVLGAMLLAPHYAWSTALLYERFALFLPPAYAWLLREQPPAPDSLARRLQPRLGLIAGLAAAAILLQHARLSFEFGREQRDFDGVLAAAAPGQRALALIYDPTSQVDRSSNAYMHHALWYQAERGGFVDFNFAAFHPQIARFRPAATPAVDEIIAQNPTRFDWRADAGDRYRYIFVRSAGAPPAQMFQGATCAPVQIAAAGKWRLYEHRPCAVANAAG
ncbi:hypothetical protein [Phenylobacterium sp.]|uniref:hypothetical protein n=1 Tax=Phenylobacterium sp. TaxID=1871053 RepID=UPI002DE5F8ED|nr:hypothetical protein [Phenylobacterium sp.]